MRYGCWIVLGGLAAGCASQGELAELQARNEGLQAKVAELKADLDHARERIDALTKESAKARQADAMANTALIAAARSELRLADDQRLVAAFETSMGAIPCRLWPEVAPETVLNFVGLAEGTKEWIDPVRGGKSTQPLYDGTIFHRVIDGFMVQGGDPLGTGRGGPGYTFGDEIRKDVTFDRPGLLAMANAGPNTNGSQFFITVAPAKHLNNRHTIFGECDTDTLMRIAKVETGGPEGSKPVEDVVLKTVRVQRENSPSPDVADGEPG